MTVVNLEVHAKQRSALSGKLVKVYQQLCGGTIICETFSYCTSWNVEVGGVANSVAAIFLWYHGISAKE